MRGYSDIDFDLNESDARARAPFDAEACGIVTVIDAVYTAINDKDYCAEEDNELTQNILSARDFCAKFDELVKLTAAELAELAATTTDADYDDV